MLRLMLRAGLVSASEISARQPEPCLEHELKQEL